MDHKVKNRKKQGTLRKDPIKWGDRFRSIRKNELFRTPREKGQVTVELILLGVVLIVVAQIVLKQIKDNEYIEDFAKGPSQVIANMMANGNWRKDPADSKTDHPNSHKRHYSWDPQ